MIGQSFAPLGDPNQMQRPGGPSGTSDGAQQAIQVLNYRMPHFGANAPTPAPQALLNGAGSAGLGQGGNPVIDAILKAVLGHFAPQQQAAPSAPGGMVPGSGPMIDNPPSPQLPTPAVHYQPLPGGTAGPNPTQDNRPQNHYPPGRLNGFDYRQ